MIFREHDGNVSQMRHSNSINWSLDSESFIKSKECWPIGKIAVTIAVIVWTSILWFFTGWMIYNYIIHPDGQSWNSLPNLCCNLTQTIPIYMHINGATIMLIIGPFQLTNIFYKTCIHKYTGCLYIIGAFLAAIGGLLFMSLNGTVGGNPMTIPFTIYGLLVLLCATMVTYFALKRDIDSHRYWAFRMYMIGSASVFYRVLYFLACPSLECDVNFNSPRDYAFNWLFFVIPIIITEIWLALYDRLIWCRGVRSTDYMVLPIDSDTEYS